ncbi:hypothetical protein ACFQ1M_01820 [Sungkyunkwania multivorans]|uniref:Shell matrix protein n=1 Tax=Sungkyunkwania multivorans TaxID=1173618 RepID=A0ABW3CT31_9FLAO
MKKINLILLLLIFSAEMFGQKNIYVSKRFDELSKDHKELAIIPFLTTLQLDEKLSEEKLEEMENKESYTVQNALESYFLKRKKRKKFTVEFQNIEDTNTILKRNNITLQNLDTYTTQELCKILDVDGLISGNLLLSTIISEDIDDSFDIVSIFRGKSNFGRISIKVSDGSTGKLLWKYAKTINRKSGRNTFAIVEAMMRKASRKFPYDKD